MLHYLDLSKESDPEKYISGILPLVYEAQKYYFDWIFGEREIALENLKNWMGNPSSGLSISRVFILVDKNNFVGEIMGICGIEFEKGQKADTFALLKETKREDRKKIISQLAAFQGLYPPVEPDEYYLRSYGIISEYRGKGLGKMLLKKFLETGYAIGYRKFKADVIAENVASFHLLKSVGFKTFKESTNPLMGIKLISMCINY